MIKGLVFFDLDGTLLNDKSQVDERVLKNLEDLRKNKYLPIIATGRTIAEVPHILEETKINSAVFMNGQAGILNGEVLYQNKIEPSLIENIIKMAEKNNEAISFYSIEEIKITSDTEIARGKYKLVNAPFPEIDRNYHKENPTNMLLVHTENLDKKYQENFPELEFVRNDPYSIDVFTKGNSKAVGIKKFVKEGGFEGLPIYAFGDGLNDMEMIEMADYGIVMENGVEELKEKADYITSSNLDGGIEEGLKKYNLI